MADTADERNLYEAYLGVCVLKTMCESAGFSLGAKRCVELLRNIEDAHPEFAVRACLQKCEKDDKG